MWRKPNDSQPSSQAPDPSSPTKAQSLPQPPAPRVPSQPASSFSPPVAESAAAPVSRGTSKIASGLKIQGELSGSSDLYVDGEVQGKIRLADARITVGPNGRVQADIEAREIVIDGSVQGNLKAGERIHLGSTSRVVGGVLTPRIGIDDGARLRGKVEMTPVNPPRQSSTVPSTPDSGTPQPETVGTKAE
jgi:cytoskeletal protein CcmA (bactofilin family)